MFPDVRITLKYTGMHCVSCDSTQCRSSYNWYIFMFKIEYYLNYHISFYITANSRKDSALHMPDSDSDSD